MTYFDFDNDEPRRLDSFMSCRRLGYKAYMYSCKALKSYEKKRYKESELYIEKAIAYSKRLENEIEWNDDVINVVDDILCNLHDLMNDYDVHDAKKETLKTRFRVWWNKHIK